MLLLFKDQLTFKVLAWTPSTKGTVTAPVFQMVPPESRSKDLTKYLDSIKGQIKGKIVMVGKAEVVPVVIDVPARRMEDKAAADRFDPKNPNAGQFGPQRNGQRQEYPPGTLTAQQINQQIDEFLLANGARMRSLISALPEQSPIRTVALAAPIQLHFHRPVCLASALDKTRLNISLTHGTRTSTPMSVSLKTT